jgi:5'-nucleotidase
LDEEEDIDQRAILNNKVSITPIQFDLTNYSMIEKLKSWEIQV